ncbi:MAG: sulfotransferase, partial [Parafilimonas sp.]
MSNRNYKRIINIPVIEFTRRVFINKNISARAIVLLPLYYVKLIAVIPAALLQYIFYAKRINKTIITKPPIFIIGHYRSGTTYLHKLLCADKRFGFVSYYDMICPNSSLLFGNWLKKTLQVCINKLKIKTSFFNNTIPSLDEPAEEERLLINKGSAYADYWKFVFPLQQNIWQTDPLNNKAYYHNWKKEYVWLLKLITYKNRNKQLVLKSPCNTERIKYLLEIFPDAKFIYISRNPYKVFYSTKNLWNKAIQKFCLQSISSTQTAGIIFTHFSYMADQYKKYKHLIPAGNLVELQYEELELK